MAIRKNEQIAWDRRCVAREMQKHGWQYKKAWLSDTAHRLGITIPTLRSRIKRGSHKVNLESHALGTKTIMVREIV